MSSTGVLNSKEILTDLEAGCSRVSGEPASWFMDEFLLSTPLHGRRKLLGLFHQVYNSMDEQPPKDSPLNAVFWGMASMRELGGHQSNCVTMTASESLGTEKEKETSRETHLVGTRLDSVRELHHCTYISVWWYRPWAASTRLHFC